MSFAIDGTSPQGEEDTANTCEILIRALNLRGEAWQDPTRGNGVSDCIAIDSKNPDQALSIQVVRAISDSELWKELARLEHTSESDTTARRLAKELRISIDRKAGDEGIPAVSRVDLVLALDATRLPIMAFEDVIEEFRSAHSPWASKLGFSAIWLVGPTEHMTHRLD